MPTLLSRRLVAAHLVGLLLVSVAGVLAWWQFDAWQARRAAEAVDLTQLPVEPLTSVIGPDDPFPGGRVGQPVELAGRWLADATVLVSDRELDGTNGYWVVTPLVVGSTGSAVPVVRGWTPRASDLPAAPSGQARLAGYLQPSEGRTITDDDPTDDVLPQLRTADLLQRVDVDLYGAYVVQADRRTDAVNDGSAGLETALVSQLPATGRFTALRNLLYAIEWVVFGLFAGFVWWRYVRDALAAAGEPATGTEGAEGTEGSEGDPVASGT